MATQATERKSAEVRREEILEAAMKEFAHGGLHGTSTEKIAQRKTRKLSTSSTKAKAKAAAAEVA